MDLLSCKSDFLEKRHWKPFAQNKLFAIEVAHQLNIFSVLRREQLNYLFRGQKHEKTGSAGW